MCARSVLEHATIDMLLDCGATPAGTIDRAVVASLHSKGLVWLDVPIAGTDYVALTSLEVCCFLSISSRESG